MQNVKSFLIIIAKSKILPEDVMEQNINVRKNNQKAKI